MASREQERAGARRRPAGGSPAAADTRAALIAGAISALREVGFAGASARQIAARAGCNQALIFYHFGSLTDLLLAALEDISARRMDAYRELLDRTGSLTDLVDRGRSIFMEDLDQGHVTVLVEMICGAQSQPGLGERVAAVINPWRDIAETAIRASLERSPVGRLMPARQIAHAVTAGILGLELLANLDGDRSGALELFGEARGLARLLDRSGPVLGLLGLVTGSSARDTAGGRPGQDGPGLASAPAGS